MGDLGRPQGRYPEIIMLISLLEGCQECGVKNGGSCWTYGVPNPIFGGMGHPLCHGVCQEGRVKKGALMPWRILFYPREDTLKVSLLEVCQEWGIKNGVIGGC